MRPLPSSRRAPAPAGFTPADVIVALAVVAVVFLFVLMALPRTRESARLAACQRNLAQIGQAMLSYQGKAGSLPPVGVLVPVDRPIEDAPQSPHAAMLRELGVADFLGVDALKQDAPPASGPVPVGGPVPGFVCPSDAAAFGLFAAPVNYRASVGADLEGTDGPFAPGRRTTMHEVERRDGVAFTAAFAERLKGDGRDGRSLVNYALVTSIDEDPAADAWRGDAGSTWLHADYRHTLYTHFEAPGTPVSKLGRDGRSSNMGASSAHVSGVNVLMLDGSARIVAPTIDLAVWRAMGTVGPESTDAPRTQETAP